MATILCVDDEAPICAGIAEYMESAGHKALQAGDGKVALEMILTHKPDLVISDITMPVMDGIALLLELRKNHPEFGNVPFIFLSALADREHILEGLKIGADDYLTKPIDFEILANKVEASLRQMIRVEVLMEQEFIKRFKALTGDADAAPELSPAAEAEPDTVELDVPATEISTQSTASSNNLQKIFGTIFLLNNVNAYEDHLGNHRKGILDLLEQNLHNFLSKGQQTGSVVTKLPNGGALVCFQDKDRDETNNISKQLSIELEKYLRNNLSSDLDKLALETSISRELLDQLTAITEVSYETEIGLDEANDPKQFLIAIQEQIENIYTDESAPMRLTSSIRRNNGHLAPLILSTQTGGEMPIRFFNFDDETRQNIRTSFAIFNRVNLINASYLVDSLTLNLLGEKVSGLDQHDTVVVDVHFETLKSRHYRALYMTIFLNFVLKTQNKVVINIRGIPSGITSAHLDEILKPFGKHAARRIVQIEPGMIKQYSRSLLPVSCIVCSYSEMMQSNPDWSTFSSSKQRFLDAKILLVLRGLPSKNERSEFSKYCFDGYAIQQAA